MYLKKCNLPSADRLNAFLDAGFRTGYSTGHFTIGPLKLVADGALGSRTAALRKPYPDDPSNYGILNFTDQEMEELVTCELPVVVFDHVYPDRMSVLSDNKKGITDLVKHVYNNGHRKIAYIHGEYSLVTNTRVTTFRDMMNRLGLDIPKEYIREAAYHDAEKKYL